MSERDLPQPAPRPTRTRQRSSAACGLCGRADMSVAQVADHLDKFHTGELDDRELLEVLSAEPEPDDE